MEESQEGRGGWNEVWKVFIDGGKEEGGRIKGSE